MIIVKTLTDRIESLDDVTARRRAPTTFKKDTVMKPTKDGKNYLIYRCRLCGEQIYGRFFTENIDKKFLNILEFNISKLLYLIHDCNENQTGLAELIGYTGSGPLNIEKPKGPSVRCVQEGVDPKSKKLKTPYTFGDFFTDMFKNNYS